MVSLTNPMPARFTAAWRIASVQCCASTTSLRWQRRWPASAQIIHFGSTELARSSYHIDDAPMPRHFRAQRRQRKDTWGPADGGQRGSAAAPGRRSRWLSAAPRSRPWSRLHDQGRKHERSLRCGTASPRQRRAGYPPPNGAPLGRDQARASRAAVVAGPARTLGISVQWPAVVAAEPAMVASRGCRHHEVQ